MFGITCCVMESKEALVLFQDNVTSWDLCTLFGSVDSSCKHSFRGTTSVSLQVGVEGEDKQPSNIQS